MTALIAGSIAFIAISAVSLGFGWLGARSELIWVSIAASAASAVCLTLAYYRSRAAARGTGPIPGHDPVRVRPGPRPPGDEAQSALFGPDSRMGPE